MTKTSLLLIPDDKMNANDIFGIAVSYANSARFIQHQSQHTQDPRYLFPAMTCAAFALELLAKYFVFISVDKTKAKKAMHGHKVNELWAQITPDLQDIIIGMHHNKTGKPHTNALDRRREVFENAFNELVASGTSGHAQPFVDWRYPYELTDVKFMSLKPVLEVMDAFGYAAQYVKDQEECMESKND